MLAKLGLMPDQASTVAAQVDHLFYYLLAVFFFFATLIATLIVYFSVVYRRRSPDDEPTPVHGSLALELIWTIIPFAISMTIFAWGASLFVTLRRPPNDALQVFVVGRQWMWKVQHLEGNREINELHVPVGRAVKLLLTSEDVIHSFYVPAFRIKEDAVPGRYTTAWFEATKPGTYHLFCAEYCGTQHSGMIGRIVVLDPSEYQTWLASGAAFGTSGAQAASNSGGVPSVAAAGEARFAQLGCATCHRDVSGSLGPSLAGLFGRTVELKGGATVVADEGYLRESILNPQAKLVAGYRPVMPTFKGLVDEEALLQLITYIKSQSATDAAAATDAARGAS
jgi:cytochrome c oxidase subunit 2